MGAQAWARVPVKAEGSSGLVFLLTVVPHEPPLCPLPSPRSVFAPLPFTPFCGFAKKLTKKEMAAKAAVAEKGESAALHLCLTVSSLPSRSGLSNRFGSDLDGRHSQRSSWAVPVTTSGLALWVCPTSARAPCSTCFPS